VRFRAFSLQQTRAMPDRFDIQFVSRPGKLGLLSEPVNTAGWRGRGTLTIDDRGLRIAATRSRLPLAFLRSESAIAAERITQVVREGDAVRVEYSIDRGRVENVTFRLPDRQTAAEVVRQMPTTRTVEMESEPSSVKRSHERGAPAIRVLAGIGIAAVGGWIAMQWMRSAAIDPVENTRNVIAPAHLTESGPPLDPSDQPAVAEIPSEAPVAEDPRPSDTDSELHTSVPAASMGSTADASLPEEGQAVQVPRPAPQRAESVVHTDATPHADTEGEPFVPSVPEYQLPDDLLVVPIARNTVAYDVARGLLAEFEGEAREIEDAINRDLERHRAGDLKTIELGGRLDVAQRGWRELGSRLLGNPAFRDAALTGLRATLLGVVSYQARFCEAYAAALRKGDTAQMEDALQGRARAHDMLARARLYVQ